MKSNKNNSINRFRIEFYAITRLYPLHPTNRLADADIRKDVIFNSLAEAVFDNPRLLDFLAMKMKHWLRVEESEFTYALAGYLSYFKENFSAAERYFLKAININPKNLDNWFDLAFSLYHQGQDKHNLGKGILFNFDYCIKVFHKKRVDLKAIEDKLKGP